VLAGVGESPDYVVGTNLVGAYVCLEHCRRHGAQIVFLSTSRVYPVRHLRALRLDEEATRFSLAAEQPFAGASEHGVAEGFPLDGPRTFYGATKLAAEHLVEEYAETYGVRAVVDRFGVIAGPWQMGKVDQGIVAHWVLAHMLGEPLQYLGFGGEGKQVRDVLHVDDVVALIDRQLQEPDRWHGTVVNAGGGRERSASLAELTELCREATGRETAVTGGGADRPGDVPVYVSDCRLLESLTDWRPQRDLRSTVADVAAWAEANLDDLRALGR
jgi:CDP-paratose 2-epimerase